MSSRKFKTNPKTSSLLKNKDEQATKQMKLMKEKEYEKIASVVRQRTKEADEKLATMMESMKRKEEMLKSRGKGESVGRFGSQSLKNSNSNFSRYKGGSIENDSLFNIGSVSATGLTVDGKGLGKAKYDPVSTLQQTQARNHQLEATSKKFEKIKHQREKEMTEEERDQLITFLAKLKISKYFSSFLFQFLGDYDIIYSKLWRIVIFLN